MLKGCHCLLGACLSASPMPSWLFQDPVLSASAVWAYLAVSRTALQRLINMLMHDARETSDPHLQSLTHAPTHPRAGRRHKKKKQGYPLLPSPTTRHEEGEKKSCCLFLRNSASSIQEVRWCLMYAATSVIISYYSTDWYISRHATGASHRIGQTTGARPSTMSFPFTSFLPFPGLHAVRLRDIFDLPALPLAADQKGANPKHLAVDQEPRKIGA
ncbi:hypothetical protein F4780DRAFT_158666 [Xylariomycetidae sp. FL0641]|nr:hypothetical protein F4780DRAFT_158666 [Xylariomycetidae sp. FL0641]